jgi:hypothetical protein
VTEIVEDVIVELFGIVNYYLTRDPETTYYILPEKYFEPYCDYIDKRLRFYPLSEVFNCDYYILVIYLRGCQRSHNINAPSL